MGSKGSKWGCMVFRLSKIPSRITKHEDVAYLVAGAVGISAKGVKIYSIAATLNPWEAPPSKVATLMFIDVPAILASSHNEQNEWVIVADRDGALVLDIHFWGLTPLNDLEPDKHVVDCIAISGLASHPFGSWQPRGNDKTYMWIRDQAPANIPGMRTIIYGYDTRLLNSLSFEGIGDLALGFIAQIKANGGTIDGAKPLVFLAHSLGGIVLKDALCKLANSQDHSLERMILSRCMGAIMFGVPNLGMEQEHLLTVVKGKPIEKLVQDISRQSGTYGYLDRLERSFSGIGLLGEMMFYWAYETYKSPTFDPKRQKMSGPAAILVDPDSATTYRVTKAEQWVHPIARNHSEMVKFTRADPNTVPIIEKLRGLCGLSEAFLTAEDFGERITKVMPASTKSSQPFISLVINPEEQEKQRQYKLAEILLSLNSPELSAREAQIADRFEHTFEWIFEYEAFISWLKQDDGIFWINGKPGSGKSTLMKLIFTDKRTWQFSHDFERRGCDISAGFFFNYRGTAMQKTLEGLMRSVLRQILQGLSGAQIAAPLLDSLLEVAPFYAPNRNSLTGNKSEWWSMSRLEEAFRAILDQQQVDLSITFLFDALDEFDGPPDYICRFLKFLAKQPLESLTRAKVCFSSRPWEAFVSNFGSGLSLRVEDFTKTDIRYYCTTNLVPAIDVRLSDWIPQLVTEITVRAAGVFLWASLIVKEISVALELDQTPSLQSLLDRLYSLPAELSEYYHYIIQRIPQNIRWQTYALLEAAVRARSPKEFDLLYLYRTTRISDCQTHLASQQVLSQLETGRHQSILLVEAQRQVLLWGGGLVSVMPPDSTQQPGASVPTVQLMHQTVYEFIARLDFKDQVLGPAAKATYENGHSFHFKSLLTFRLKEDAVLVQFINVGDAIRPSLDHGAEAEETTGRSCQLFLRSIPVNVIIALGGDLMKCLEFSSEYIRGMIKSSLIRTRVGLATYLRLRLYLQDCVAKDSGYLTTYTSYDSLLLLTALGLWSWDPHAEQRLAAAHYLLGHGYQLSIEPKIFLNLLESTLGTHRYGKLVEGIDRFAALLLEHGQSPNEKISCLVSNRRVTCEPIHVALPTTAVSLLDHGVDINTPNSRGRTPLDCLLLDRAPLFFNNSKEHEEENRQRGLRLCYQVATIFVDRGGLRKQASEKDWENMIRVFQQQGFDTTGLPPYVPTTARNWTAKTPLPPTSTIHLPSTSTNNARFDNTHNPQLLAIDSPAQISETGNRKLPFSQSIRRFAKKWRFR